MWILKKHERQEWLQENTATLAL